MEKASSNPLCRKIFQWIFHHFWRQFIKILIIVSCFVWIFAWETEWRWWKDGWFIKKTSTNFDLKIPKQSNLPNHQVKFNHFKIQVTRIQPPYQKCQKIQNYKIMCIKFSLFKCQVRIWWLFQVCAANTNKIIIHNKMSCSKTWLNPLKIRKSWCWDKKGPF